MRRLKPYTLDRDMSSFPPTGKVSLWCIVSMEYYLDFVHLTDALHMLGVLGCRTIFRAGIDQLSFELCYAATSVLLACSLIVRCPAPMVSRQGNPPQF